MGAYERIWAHVEGVDDNKPYQDAKYWSRYESTENLSVQLPIFSQIEPGKIRKIFGPKSHRIFFLLFDKL